MAGPSARTWIFTLNNPSGPLDCDGAAASHKLRYCKWQLERGTSGTPHYQGYAEFTETMRLSAVRRWLPTAHWERRRGTREEAAAYAGKEESRVDGPWEYGSPASSSQGRRSDLDCAVATLRRGGVGAVAQEHPATFIQFHRGFIALAHHLTTAPTALASLDNYWYHGAPGTGKSSTARREFGADEDVYVKMANKWWDDYRGEATVLLDDVAPDHELQSYLKIWADHYPFRAEVKGGSVLIRPRRIVVTSNFTIERCFGGVHAKALARRFTQKLFCCAVVTDTPPPTTTTTPTP